MEAVVGTTFRFNAPKMMKLSEAFIIFGFLKQVL